MVDIPDEDTQKSDEVYCRVCGIPLLTKAETKIGVHISCVATKKFKSVTIPRPRYGDVGTR